MIKTILVYGLVLSASILSLHCIEYFFWVRLHTFEIYGGLIAVLFLTLGFWFGHKYSSTRNATFRSVEQTINYSDLGISKREFDVLLLLGKGLSNQEIADQLFVSMNTVKTHTSRIFEKLDVRNRTQAILKARQKGLILS